MHLFQWKIIVLLVVSSVSSRRPLKIHNDRRCRAEITCRHENTFAPWTCMYITCSHIVDPVISVVCDRRCRDPKTHVILDANNYCSKEIKLIIERRRRHRDVMIPIEIVVGCECVWCGNR
ncbi:uncharacterized protein LOC108949758 [Ciona intestinalis]